MKPNSSTKMTSATQFTSCTMFPRRFVSLPYPPSIPGRLWLDREIDHRRQHRRDEHAQHLEPVEERHAHPDRLGAVVERRPQDDGELQHEQEIPPAPAAPLFRYGVHRDAPPTRRGAPRCHRTASRGTRNRLRHLPLATNN